jgi:catechol 2,3-dioxygenase-like lactoylglutathione lyase family enzyme
MELGAFSISLAVEDLATSHAFYVKLGFEVVGGDADEKWLILRNGETTIGLFQGAIEENTLTFNPGLDGPTMNQLDDYTDVREIKQVLETRGIAVESHIEDESGPAHIMLEDPDGNRILIDQFF